MNQIKLTPSQEIALRKLLEDNKNIFLTGGPGTGKSFLIKEFLKRYPKKVPVVASTGASAILIRGRTFHSFFGLGIMQGSPSAIIEKAMKNGRLRKRIEGTETLVVDEVSMLSQDAFDCAEKIARAAKKSLKPWGGIRMIVVGDFAQLPPISKGLEKEWCFLSEAWKQTKFEKVFLLEVKRTEDEDFLQVLEDVRWGRASERVEAFLQDRLVSNEEVESNVPHVFPRRAETNAFNKARLDEIEGPVKTYKTEYGGKNIFIEKLKRDAPIPEVLELKEGVLVMIRMNDPKQRYVNGTVGTVESLGENILIIDIGKKVIELEPFTFTVLDDEGEEVAYARNFPITLAYANTIHKVQGTTLDRVHVSLRALWEPGQAYVALSRARSGKTITLMDWDMNSIKSDHAVKKFYEEG